MRFSFDQPPVPGGEGPEREEGGSDEIVFPDRSPVAGVQGVIGIVAEGEVTPLESEVHPCPALGQEIVTILQMDGMNWGRMSR